MKSRFIFVLVFGLIVSCTPESRKPDLTKPIEKYNYAFGLDIVSTFQQQEVEIDLKSFFAGMQDALAGKPRLTPDEQKAALKELQDDFMAKAEAAWKAAAVKNLAEGQEFLVANSRKEGMRFKECVGKDGSPAQLQYQILQSGPPGPSPKKSDVVEVHYTGTLTDGRVVDSSIKRGTPATFGMTDVIPGWTEALQMMKVGDKWRLFIPANLGYAEVAPPHIGPNRALIYEVELLSFYTPTPEQAATNAATEALPQQPR